MIRYHVQDGGSKDGTLQILAAWKSRSRAIFRFSAKASNFLTRAHPTGLYDAVIGALPPVPSCFRMRGGQLSADKARHAEIDASLSPAEIEIRAQAAKTYAWAGFEYRALTRHYGEPWRCQRWPMCIAPIFGTKVFRAEHWRLSVMARFANESSG